MNLHICNLLYYIYYLKFYYKNHIINYDSFEKIIYYTYYFVNFSRTSFVFSSVKRFIFYKIYVQAFIRNVEINFIKC